MSNYFCNGKVQNNNPKSPIRFFEIVTVREYSDLFTGGTYIDEIHSVEDFLDVEKLAYDDPFYQVYGIRSNKHDYIFLGEFLDIDKAKEFLYNLTGEIPQVISY